MENLNIQINCHSSICVNNNIYFDPINIDEKRSDADYIFVTHSHYDHLEISSIQKIMMQNTKIIATGDVINELIKNNINSDNIFVVEPNKKYKLNDITFETFSSYNINKQFHPKQNGWVGYRVVVDNVSYVVCGDTDLTEELKNIKCDVLFVPIGGTYTMDATEGAILANIIKPKLVIPVHYGSIVGNKTDYIEFCNNLNNDIKYLILIK